MRSFSLIIVIILIVIIIVAIVGVYFGYNMFFNKSNLINTSNISISLNNTGNLTNIQSSSNNSNNLNNLISGSQSTGRKYTYDQYIPITIYNTQPVPTPTPFQQQIAICNKDLKGLNISSPIFWHNDVNISRPNFVYIADKELFGLIKFFSGSNVYFTTTVGGSPNIYSWYAGRLEFYDINNRDVVICHIWWIKLPNGIPANSYITIYMYIGDYIRNLSLNYYQQYYPYVGASPQVDPSRQYDNGKYVFIAYGYFNNTLDEWKAYNYSGLFSPIQTPYGIMMVNGSNQGTYIIPPNNGNIPKIPMIVEISLYYDGYVDDVSVIALFGNTDKQINASSIGSIGGYYTPVPDLSTFVEFNMIDEYIYLKSAMTKTILKRKDFSSSGYALNKYLYLIVNSTHVQAGHCKYVMGWDRWTGLEILNTYSFIECDNISSNLNYNPFQYGTLQISAGTEIGAKSYQYIQWVIARAYPPNGVMPRIYIG